MKKFILFNLFILLFSANLVAQENLKLGMLITSGIQRATLRGLIKKFEKENPGTKVKFFETNNERYHASIKSWITGKDDLDVLFWFAGHRLGEFAKKGLVEPIDDIWKKEKMNNYFSNLKSAVTTRGKIYGLPLSYYQWGFYYNQAVFAKNKVKPPKNWNQFLKACETFKKNGIAPISVGTKNNWPAASWFSYFNLRINGLKFHKRLMAGKVSYNSPKVKKVFTHWKTLIDKGYFIKNNAQLDFKNSLPYVYRGNAAMTLIGNFVVGTIPKAQIKKIKFFKFPKITGQPYYEEAPTDVLMIRKKSKNKATAKKLLAFMAKANNQYKYNNAVGFISPNKRAKKSSDYFISQGIRTLRAAKGISQFFDRDTPEKMAYGGFKVFGEFVRDGNVNKAIKTLEKLRKQAY